MNDHGRPTLRDQLVRLRQQRGISQAELAQRIGVTQTAVSYWETGRRQPGLDDVERWAAALGATPSLLQGSPAAGSNEPGDLRERLREALTREHYRRASERIEASPEEHCAGFAAAVLPVVEHELLAIEVNATRRADELAAQLQQAGEVLRGLVDIRPCDMRGRWCQAHLESAPCPQGEAQRHLAAPDQPEEP